MNERRHRVWIILFTAGALLALQACGSGDGIAAAPQAGPSAVSSGPVSDGGVTPYIVDDPGPGGNVTCEHLGFDYCSARQLR